MKQPKKLYYILHDDEYVGQTWAPSGDKAVTNYWWKTCKGGDPFAYTDYKPTDFDAVCVGRQI